MAENLQLKWGTVKGWNGLSEKSMEILQRFFADGMPLAAMADRPNEQRKTILCELIDQLDGEITNEWTGDIMSKDDAKKYVMEY
jgi:hypothetical protein